MTLPRSPFGKQRFVLRDQKESNTKTKAGTPVTTTITTTRPINQPSISASVLPT